MENYKEKKVIIRSNGAGVFFGTLNDYDMQNGVVELLNTRRLWYWSGACSLSQLATEGVKYPNDCKFTVIVPQMQVANVLEVIPCTEQAVKNIENVPVWKK
ncbi:MAG: hypothetical protein IJS13_00350 [Paludibacteraceae bacterium]|nr:hypothetical protein [Paludibacteraceae bacterium]MBR0064189.1 hypothetical protein [Paludibacteraceae bacterium]